MNQILRQILVIARRDFLAVAGTPTFLLFLLAPFFMLSFGAIGGLGGARIAGSGETRTEMVAVADGTVAERLKAEDAALRGLVGNGQGPALLQIVPPKGDVAVQAKALLAEKTTDVSAVMHGPADHPVIIYRTGHDRDAAYLAALAKGSIRRANSSDSKLSTATLSEIKQPQAATKSGAQAAGAGAVFVIFLLTLLLAGQTVGMMAEEKANKVIEILAAAVPLEAVFFGKLLGMFGVSMLFITFWGTLATIGIALMPASVSLASYAPAIGMPLFLILGVLYFSMAYMLLGAVFLGVGAQASTMREIQMMSLPITLLQVGMFALSTAAAGSPGSDLARFAEWFPFSSPFAMAARGATEATLWPHLLALIWQAVWVGIVIWIAARMFRRGVLKSGGGLGTLFGRRTA